MEDHCGKGRDAIVTGLRFLHVEQCPHLALSAAGGTVFLERVPPLKNTPRRPDRLSINFPVISSVDWFYCESETLMKEVTVLFPAGVGPV